MCRPYDPRTPRQTAGLLLLQLTPVCCGESTAVADAACVPSYRRPKELMSSLTLAPTGLAARSAPRALPLPLEGGAAAAPTSAGKSAGRRTWQTLRTVDSAHGAPAAAAGAEAGAAEAWASEKRRCMGMQGCMQ